MKKAITLSLILVALSLNLKAQEANNTKNVGIGTLTPNQSAILDLDVSSNDFATKLGFLVPRVTAEQRNGIQNPATGLLVYVTEGETPGFYYYTGTAWKSIDGGGAAFGDQVENAVLYYSTGNVIQSSANFLYSSTDNAVSLTGTAINLKSATDGNAQDIKFYENGANGTENVSVKAPADLTENITFELPKNNPEEGQVLSRTANGTEWTTPSGVPAGQANGIVYYNDAGSEVSSSENLIYNPTDNAISLTGTSVNLKPSAAGDAQDIKFYENSANSIEYISLKAPAELEENITFELPNNNPVEGQVLTRTANGTQWAAPSGGVPIGTILPFAGAAAPEGWMIADGAELSSTEYPELFAVIGNTYGSNGTNFYLPNLSGRFPMGLDNELGSQVGQNGGGEATLEAANIPAHQHTLITRGATLDQTNPTIYELAMDNYAGTEKPSIMSTSVIFGHPNNMDYNVSFPVHSSTIEGPEGVPTPVKIMPPYLKILYIIRVK